MANSPAAKRLARILADEEYGPKLARMNRRNEAYILDLIDRNQGRKARAEIVRLDESRRAQRREREAIRKRGSTLDASLLRVKAANNIIRQVGGNPNVVKKHVKYMDKEDLTFAALAKRGQIQSRARETAYIDAPDLDIEINPFWYH